MSLRRYRFYAYLIMLALASSFLVQLIEIDDSSRGIINAQSPDVISKGYSKVIMDEQGKPKQNVVAEQVRHYPHDGTTHFVQPTLFFYDAKTPPWVIHSETAVLSGDGENLALQGKVAIERAKAKCVSELHIYTRDVAVKPKTRHAETLKYTELVSPPHITSGTGMTLVFTKPVHLKLLARVRGKYAGD